MASIRLAADTDAAAIAALYRPIVESTTISFETQAPTDGEMSLRIFDTQRVLPWLACDVNGRLAGYAYASRHRLRAAYQWSVDTSVYVDDVFRRAGVATGLYTSLLAILTAQGYFNAFAGIALPNEASVALHERLGFEPVGIYRNVGFKLGGWHDVGWWQRPLVPPHEPAHLPIALPSMLNRADWEALLSAGVTKIRR